ncbi:MAG: hypothetical protein K0S37_4086 [Microbacterium sp.]|nr:hypothetical protein [Microbacterium sp.]
MHLIRASISAGIRPSAPLLRVPDPHGSWTKHDYLLLEAVQIISDEQCPDCGYPVWVCRNESSDIQFDVRRTTCEAKRQTELTEREYQGPGKEKPPGLSLVPEPKVVSGAPLGSFRMSYYEQQKKRREAMSD